MTAHFGGTHLAAPTLAQRLIAGARAYLLILAVAALAGMLGGLLTGGF